MTIGRRATRATRPNNDNNSNNNNSVTIETLSPLDPSALDFLGELGRRLSAATGDVCETTFLFQALSVVIQRYDSAL